MRQTQLTVKEIMQELKNPSGEYPNCLLINELGMICSQGKHCRRSEESITAEESLRSLLDSENSKIKLGAYCVLTVMKNQCESTILKLVSFRSYPGNAGLLKEAEAIMHVWSQQRQ